MELFTVRKQQANNSFHMFTFEKSYIVHQISSIIKISIGYYAQFSFPIPKLGSRYKFTLQTFEIMKIRIIILLSQNNKTKLNFK